MSDSVVLRAARANQDDGRDFARLLNVASDGLFETLLGRRFEAIVAEAYLSPGHDLSFERAVMADLDGQTIGVCSGYTWEQHANSTEGPLLRAAGLTVIRMGALGVLARGLFAFMNDIPEGDFYVQALAVDDAMRGKGVGAMLLKNAEYLASANRCARLVLDVSETNEVAIRLYERHGLKVTAKSPRIPLTPGSAVFRMVKDL